MRILITGGAGFIGSNAVNYLAVKGHDILVFDNLSSHGSGSNLEWLRKSHPGLLFVEGDVRSREPIEALLRDHRDVDVVLHMAGREGTRSAVADLRNDFEINALGTLNVLEATRQLCPGALFIFPSTSKVYGGLQNVPVVEQESRWEFSDLPNGIPESYPLDLASPHPCSRGVADQYVSTYARTYGLRTVILRQSCIYGPHQFGTEDRGWVAWFTIAAELGRPITVYGDGKQVRDVLFIDDFLTLLDRVIEMQDRVAGQVYNVGGGPQNTVSVRELLHRLREITEREMEIAFAQGRPEDRPVYVSDITKAQEQLQWEPRVPLRRGLRRLYRWVADNRHLLKEERSSSSDEC